MVNEGLSKKSMEAFLPKVQVRSKRRDRKVLIRAPLFPGYLFVKTDLNPLEQLEIVKTAGVVRFIGNKSGPLPVPTKDIESLKIMVAENDAIVTGTRFKKGDKVIVIDGPLAGVTGIFSRYRGKERVVVNIEALGRFAGVNVRKEDVEILPKIIS